LISTAYTQNPHSSTQFMKPDTHTPKLLKHYTNSQPHFLQHFLQTHNSLSRPNTHKSNRRYLDQASHTLLIALLNTNQSWLQDGPL